MTKEQIEQIKKLAESHDFKGLPIPQLCDLAVLGTIIRDAWYAEYFQPSVMLHLRARSDLDKARHEWLTAASKQERDELAALGRQFMGEKP